MNIAATFVSAAIEKWEFSRGKKEEKLAEAVFTQAKYSRK